MKRLIGQSIKSIMFIAIMVLIPCVCNAVEINGVKFEKEVVVKGVDLKLNGVSVLKWAMLFDVYAGGFYLPAEVDGHQWEFDVPKKLELSYFRKIEAEGFARASDNLLRKNLTQAEYLKISERLNLFYGLFQDVVPGDRYSIVYIPEYGTELRLNNKALGYVPGHDFATAYFGIWLGGQPINKKFRDQLLQGNI